MIIEYILESYMDDILHWRHNYNINILGIKNEIKWKDKQSFYIFKYFAVK